MPIPTAGDVHVNMPLTNISIAYNQSQDAYIADKAFSVIPVAKQSDLYYEYDRGDFNRDEMKKRGESEESAGAGYRISTTPYLADVWALHKDISDRVRANADSVLKPDQDATEYLTNQALISREKSWATNFFAASIWATDVTPGTLWDAANSTPIEDVRAGKAVVLAATGFEPNTMIVGYEVFNILLDHVDVIDRVKYGQTPNGPAMVDAPELAAIFKVEKFLVMRAIENTAAEAATETSAFIGGKHALLCYTPAAPGLMTPAAGYTFAWTGYLGASPNGMRIKRFRMEQLASDRVEIEQAYDHKLVSADLGYFLESVIS